MVAIGEVKLAKEIGRIGTNRFIWYACADCGKERWVLLVQGRPKYTLCLNCSMKGEVNHNWKGGIKCVNGYIYLSPSNHPHIEDYTGRARLVLEQKLGRPLLPNMIPHHKNEIRDDDRPENLEELTRSEHTKLHSRRNKLGKEIYIDSYCCGNCTLNADEICWETNFVVYDSKPACNLIHDNFIDRGYKMKLVMDIKYKPKGSK